MSVCVCVCVCVAFSNSTRSMVFIVALLCSRFAHRRSYVFDVFVVLRARAHAHTLTFAGRRNKRNRLKTILRVSSAIAMHHFCLRLIVADWNKHTHRAHTHTHFDQSKILCAVRKIYFDFNWIIISCASSSLIIFTHSNAWKLCYLCTRAMHCVCSANLAQWK